MLTYLAPHDDVDAFPALERAAKTPNGLLALGGDLSPARLLAAYQRGIFPWYSSGEPIMWWSPDPRMVLFPSEFHASRSLKKHLRRAQFRFSINQAFTNVIQACAGPRAYADGTWITREMQSAYRQLHAIGKAHSVEIWQQEELVGGLYGVALGRVFFGESMFSEVDNASKAAFWVLSELLVEMEFTLIDCQVYSTHLETLGAREIPRQQFASYLPATDSVRQNLTWPAVSGDVLSLVMGS